MDTSPSRYEYELRFIQWLLNPRGVAAFRLLVLAFCGSIIGWVGTVVLSGQVTISIALWATVLVLFFSTFLVISLGFIGYGSWASSKGKIWVEFRENGLATNFGGLSTPTTGLIFPYQHLMIKNGLLGTMTIESISGHYLLVVRNAFPESELDVLSRKASGDFR